MPDRPRPPRSTTSRDIYDVETGVRSRSGRLLRLPGEPAAGRRLAEDGQRTLSWPTTELHFEHAGPQVEPASWSADPEPNMRWRQFSALLASALTSASVRKPGDPNLLARVRGPGAEQAGLPPPAGATTIVRPVLRSAAAAPTGRAAPHPAGPVESVV